MEGRSCSKDNCSGRFHYVRGGPLKSRGWRASNDQTVPMSSAALRVRHWAQLRQPVQQRDDTKPGPSNAPVASVIALTSDSDNDEEPLLGPGVTIDCIDICSSDEDTAKPYKGQGKRAPAVQDENLFFLNGTVPTGAEALDLSAAPQHVGTLSERLKKRFRTAA